MARPPLAAALPWLGLVLLLSAAAKPAPDGLGLLRRVAATYRGARRFALTGDIHARLTSATGSDTSSATFVAASAGKGRLRDQLEFPNGGVTRVSDGARSWVYDAQQRQYVESAQALRTPDDMDSLEVREMGGITGALLNSYRLITEGADSVTVLPPETLRFGGRPRACDVVRARYASGERTMYRTFWIERARGVVLRQQTTLRTQGEAGTVLREETLAFRSISLNESVPDSLFVFRPPAGAAKVERLAGVETAEDELTGKPATDFTLADLEGRQHRLSDERGKVVMLDFWATWCGPCRMQMPAVDRLYQEFKDKGLVVFAVNQRESADRARAYLEKFSYTTTTLLDLQGEVGQKYGVRGIPTLVIIGRDGNIVAHWVGVHPEVMLRAGLKKAGIE